MAWMRCIVSGLSRRKRLNTHERQSLVVSGFVRVLKKEGKFISCWFWSNDYSLMGTSQSPLYAVHVDES